VEASAALASGDRAALDEELAAAARAVEAGRLPARALEEALLQSYLFLGFPAALGALEAWREVGPGVPPERDPLAVPERTGAWTERGESVCRKVYGRAYRPLRRNIADLHPAMDRWMVTEGYGKVLGRPGLSLGDRELCIVALLAVTGRRPQLHSHLRGALNVGVAPGAVEGALDRALARSGDRGWRAEARELWDRVRDRARRRDAGERADSS
jgi:4-carboxymuconolactone decarboxylase